MPSAHNRLTNEDCADLDAAGNRDTQCRCMCVSVGVSKVRWRRKKEEAERGKEGKVVDGVDGGQGKRRIAECGGKESRGRDSGTGESGGNGVESRTGWSRRKRR